MMREKNKFQQLTSNEVCQIYELLREDNKISFSIPIDAYSKIDSLVSNTVGSNYGSDNYQTIGEKIVAYLYFIIKNHCFVDGNKRTGVLCFKLLCTRNKLNINIPDTELDEVAIFLEKTVGNHQVIIKSVADFLFNKTN